MKDCKHGKLVFSDTTACVSSHYNCNYDLTKFSPEGRRKRTASVVDDAVMFFFEISANRERTDGCSCQEYSNYSTLALVKFLFLCFSKIWRCAGLNLVLC